MFDVEHSDRFECFIKHKAQTECLIAHSDWSECSTSNIQPTCRIDFILMFHIFLLLRGHGQKAVGV